MKQPYFMSTCGTGEDVLFCYNARKVGAQVFMDTSVKLGHIGPAMIIDEAYAKDYWATKEKRNIQKVDSPYLKYKTNGRKVLV